ncbi:MAG: fibronectin type III domain-containing protein [Verrucomicrobia bacterium]|nr:fibronectin type III domain-containing protein [Verrucomicrobiota bacterium]
MKRLALVVAASLAVGGRAWPDQSVTLAWDPNPEPDVRGYIVYYGTESRCYPHSTNVGNVTTATVHGLREGVTWYFAITAVNGSGLESDFSHEITNAVPSRETLDALRAARAADPPPAAAPTAALPPDRPASADRRRAAGDARSRATALVLARFEAWKARLRSVQAGRRLKVLARHALPLAPLSLGVAGCFLAAAGALNLRRYRRAWGTVELRSDDAGGTGRAVVVYTRAEGVVCAHEPRRGDLGPGLRAGDKVPVRYHPRCLHAAYVPSRRARWRRWRWPLLAGVVGLLGVAAAAALLLRPAAGANGSGAAPGRTNAGASARPSANGAHACRSRLEYLGLAVQMWALDHGGRLPTNASCLRAYVGDPGALACPGDRDTPVAKAAEWHGVDFEKGSYDMRFPGSAGADPVTVIIRCKKHGHILHATLRSVTVMESQR